MALTKRHLNLLAKAFEEVLRTGADTAPDPGDMAYVRCLSPEVVQELANGQSAFALPGWQVWCVADKMDEATRTITADRAVELREAKQQAVLLLVDTTQAGAGMDGIYSAAREINETTLFNRAIRLVKDEIGNRDTWRQAEQAIKRAGGHGRRYNISRWTEFDYLVRLTDENRQPGELVHMLGLWPIRQGNTDEAKDITSALEISRHLVERLLSTTAAGMPPSERIKSIKLHDATERQEIDLERFLHAAATRPLLPALADLADKSHLWVNALQIEGKTDDISSIELIPWRTKNGRVAKWSGLHDGANEDSPPKLLLAANANNTGNYATLTIRWKCRPDNLTKGAVDYQVAIMTDMEEALAEREVRHSGTSEQTCRFTNDDFSSLGEDALISAKVVVSVIGNGQVRPQESEEFTIQFGEPPDHEPAGVGKTVRTFSEGVIELKDRAVATTLASGTDALPRDTKGFVIMRPPQGGKSLRVFYPPLLREVEQDWAERQGQIGRWRVRVRASGARATGAEFIPIEASEESVRAPWDRTVSASRKLAERFGSRSGVGQLYDDKSRGFDSVVKEYLLSWSAVLEKGNPAAALANTVEIQTLSGNPIGLIVLPSHPLRVAWHVAYDNLVLHTAFEQGGTPKAVREEFAALDGALFPAFLPGVEGVNAFVFADMLGFFAAGMVPDHDKEPKAAIAIMARALGESETADTAPTIGEHSAQVLGNEIIKYIDYHNDSKLLHIHALRPGDGLTVARALGQVQANNTSHEAERDPDESPHKEMPAFVLELYPSPGQRGVAGRFIAEVREKRRSGTGTVSSGDRWMLESLSLPGGINMPKLRWARKNDEAPRSAAHLAIAFDTFESRMALEPPNWSARPARPYYIYGLLSFLERDFSLHPSPLWRSGLLAAAGGDRHPSDKSHTDRLIKLQQAVERCVAQSASSNGLVPILQTEISPEKADNLRELHRRCDWVITLDRNGGIEYFDSPRDNRDVYDVFVIDAVPERDDLGSLQLITSTSNLAEIRNLLDGTLDQMGLSHSRKNAEFLMDHLKALSGRLAIRLTGQKAPSSELIALALSHANCEQSGKGDECWVPLNEGFLVPVDDIRDLIPPLSGSTTTAQDDDTSNENARPDLIYVSMVPRKGLSFQFIEVKYRRNLSSSRSPEVLNIIQRQVQSLRKRWDEWYSEDNVAPSFRAVRRAKLARMLRFYADKAHRHYLSDERYNALVAEIDRMIEKGGDYSFAPAERLDCGWVFCPEYNGTSPQEVSPPGWSTRIFVFGPSVLPDFSLGVGSPIPSPEGEKGGRSGNPRFGGNSTRDGAYPDDEKRATGETPPESPPKMDWAKTGGAPGAAPGSARPAPEPGAAPPPQGPDRPGIKDNRILLGTDALQGSDVYWPITIKGNPHLLVAGLPGMGKTTFLVNLCRQMLESDIRPIVFSYHEDIDEQLEKLGTGVRFLDFRGLGFNPLQVINRDSPMAYLDMAGAMRDIFMAIYPELGDIQGERIRKAIKDSFIEQGWNDPHVDLKSLVEPNFGRFVEILRDTPKPDQGLRTLLARLDELDDYGLFDIDESATNLWESDRPVVIRIHKTQNDNLQKAFASLVFYGLYKDMFRRGVQQRITHAVVFDEAHRAGRLRLIPTMAKECRKYGISLVLASQEARDFNASLFSAVANYLVLRLNETDAKALVRNVASSDQERMLVDRIKQMDRFKAMYFSEGKRKPTLVSLRP